VQLPVVGAREAPLERLEIAASRNLDAVLADLTPLTVFVDPNGSGKTNLVTALSALHPTLLTELLMGRRVGPETALGTHPPVLAIGGGACSAAIGAKDRRGVVLELRSGGGDGLIATWSRGGATAARPAGQP
jgi:hypothetical protein